MRGRLPATLLNGRVRTSTVLLSVLFVAVLTLYLQVRPPPETDPSSRDSSERGVDTTPRSTSSVPAPTTTTSTTPTTTATTPTRTTPSTRPRRPPHDTDHPDHPDHPDLAAVAARRSLRRRHDHADDRTAIAYDDDALSGSASLTRPREAHVGEPDGPPADSAERTRSSRVARHLRTARARAGRRLPAISPIALRPAPGVVQVGRLADLYPDLEAGAERPAHGRQRAREPGHRGVHAQITRRRRLRWPGGCACSTPARACRGPGRSG